MFFLTGEKNRAQQRGHVQLAILPSAVPLGAIASRLCRRDRSDRCVPGVPENRAGRHAPAVVFSASSRAGNFWVYVRPVGWFSWLHYRRVIPHSTKAVITLREWVQRFLKDKVVVLDTAAGVILIISRA